MKFLCAIILIWCSCATANPEQNQSTSSNETSARGISAEELKALLSSGLPKLLSPPPALAFSDDDVRYWAEKAKYAHSNAMISRGNIKEKYDLIVQIGHFPRKSGVTGGQGKYVSEQQVAALVGVSLIQKLSQLKVNNAPIKALLVGADDFNSGLNSKIFLALHTDSTNGKCLVGPSVGYQKIADASGMHGIALALAITLGQDAEKFMKDNYTSGLSGYYAYSKINSEFFKGVLEMSELTCPAQEAKLLTSAASLATNLAIAIQFALRK